MMHRTAIQTASAKKPLIECIRNGHSGEVHAALRPGAKAALAGVAAAILLLGNCFPSVFNETAISKTGILDESASLKNDVSRIPRALGKERSRSLPYPTVGAPTMLQSINGAYDQQEFVVFTGPFRKKKLTTVVNAVTQTGERTLLFSELLNGYTDKGYWCQAGVEQNYLRSWMKGLFYMHVEVFNRDAKSINGNYGRIAFFNGPVFDEDEVKITVELKGGMFCARAIDLSTKASACYSTPAEGSFFIGDYSKEHITNSTGFRFTGFMNEAYHLLPSAGIFEAPVSYRMFWSPLLVTAKEDYMPAKIAWNRWYADATLDGRIDEAVALKQAASTDKEASRFISSDVTVTFGSNEITIGSEP